MAELKTKQSGKSVGAFLRGVSDERKRGECSALLRMMEKATKAKARMWGDSIVGFGAYHYKYESGREGDWFLTGFSPRKQNLAIYVMSGFDRHEALMSKLGKHKTGKSCLYVRTLEDVEMPVLRQLIEQSVKWMSRSRSSSL